jgi:hypothetical protein
MTDTLVERLEERALELHSTAWGRMDGGQECTISATLAEEAAKRIAALQRSNAEKDEALDIARKQIVEITCDATQKLREIGYECDPPERTYMPALDRISKALSHSGEVVDEKPV